MIQQLQQAAEHASSDSVSGSAIQKALSSGAIVNWKVAATLLIVAFLAGLILLYIGEFRAIRKAGGFKAWIDDLPLVQYRTVRMGYVSEVTVVVLVLGVMAHAVWPQVVGEIQVEAVYAIFAFLGLNTGLNVTAFIGKRATEDVAVQSMNAAMRDPNVIPLVRTNKKTGETVVEHVPVVQPIVQQANGAPITVTAERAVVNAAETQVTTTPAKLNIVRGRRDD